MQENFATIDTNKDNQLDEAELRKYYTERFANFGQGGRGGDGGRRPGGDGNRRPGGDNDRPNEGGNRPARPSGDVEL